MLVPGLNYAFDTFVECQSDKGVSDNVKVMHKKNCAKRQHGFDQLTEKIHMPVS